jgi:hypothetical protein
MNEKLTRVIEVLLDLIVASLVILLNESSFSFLLAALVHLNWFIIILNNKMSASPEATKELERLDKELALVNMRLQLEELEREKLSKTKKSPKKEKKSKKSKQHHKKRKRSSSSSSSASSSTSSS